MNSVKSAKTLPEGSPIQLNVPVFIADLAQKLTLQEGAMGKISSAQEALNFAYFVERKIENLTKIKTSPSDIKDTGVTPPNALDALGEQAKLAPLYALLSNCTDVLDPDFVHASFKSNKLGDFEDKMNAEKEKVIEAVGLPPTSKAMKEYLSFWEPMAARTHNPFIGLTPGVTHSAFCRTFTRLHEAASLPVALRTRLPEPNDVQENTNKNPFHFLKKFVWGS